MSDEKDKIKDLAAERRKRAKPQGAPGQAEKIKTVLVYQTLTDVINGKPPPLLPPFPARYYVYGVGEGQKLILREKGDSVVEIVSDEILHGDLLRYTRDNVAEFEHFQITHRQARETIDYWRTYTLPPDPAPRPFAWQGETGLCFRRLPWSLKTGPMPPTWGKLLGQMTNAQAFCDWIGSLFFEQSYNQQYVWLHGTGNDGKGSLNRFLAKVFGPVYCAKQPPSRHGDRFWSFALLGKRLVVFPDCNDKVFIAGSLFKSLTGADPVDVEAKGKMSFTTEMNAKYLVISNEKPTISSEKADQRRIIYCRLQDRGTEENDPAFERRLWEEGGTFLANCMSDYLARHPTHGPIAAQMDEIADWVDTVEGDYIEALDFHFELGEAYTTPPIIMQRIIKTIWKDRWKQLDFLHWLERVHGIRKKDFGPKASRLKNYAGIKPKPEGHLALLECDR